MLACRNSPLLFTLFLTQEVQRIIGNHILRLALPSVGCSLLVQGADIGSVQRIDGVAADSFDFRGLVHGCTESTISQRTRVNSKVTSKSDTWCCATAERLTSTGSPNISAKC